MLLVRGTKKLRDRVRGVAAVEDDLSSGALGDWFANALFWRRPQVALLVNSRTLLPVFMELAPVATLLDRVPEAIERVLRLHGVGEVFLAEECKAMSEVRIGPTNDRSVVGVMNEFAFQGEHLWKDGAKELDQLSVRLASLIVGPLMKGSGSPDRELAAVVGGTGAAAVVAPTRQAYQLKVTLLDTKPPIWRRVVVDGGCTLDHLHEVIQAAFGWWNYHLHEFEIERRRTESPIPTRTGASRHSTNDYLGSTRSRAKVRRSATRTTSAMAGTIESSSRRSSQTAPASRPLPASTAGALVHRKTAEARGATGSCSRSSRTRPTPSTVRNGSGSAARSIPRRSTPPSSTRTSPTSAPPSMSTSKERPETLAPMVGSHADGERLP